MNKKVFGRKLSRSRPAREALFASLTRSLILNGKIETTKAKAAAVKGQVEKYVTMAKKGDISARSRVFAGLDNAEDALTKLYKKVVPAFSSRNSGFTRIISLPNRKGDNAKMVRMEWTEKIVEEGKKEPKSKVKGQKAKETASPRRQVKTKKVVKKVAKRKEK